MRRILPFALAVILTGGLFFVWKRGPSETPSEPPGSAGIAEVSVAVAERRPIRETAALLGVLEPEPNASTLVSAQVAGRILALPFKEGDAVRAGEVVARLDPGETSSQLAQATLSIAQEKLRIGFARRQAESGLQAATAGVKKTESELAALQASNRAEIEKARAALATAQRSRELVKAGSRPQEIASARAAKAEAEAQNQSAQANLTRTKRLLEEQVVSQRQFEEARAAAQVSEGLLREASERLTLVEEGSRKEDIAVAEAKVVEAESALSAAKTATRSEASKRQELVAARALLESARAALAQTNASGGDVQQKVEGQRQAEVRARYLTIAAPISGVVTRRTANVGDSAQPGATLLELGQPGCLRLRVGVPATRLTQLRPGQEATVRFDGASVRARVARVGSGSDGSGNGVAYLTMASLAGLHAGQSGTASVTLSASGATVAVPVSALIEEEGGDAVVTVDAENVAHRKKVLVGAREGEWVALSKGVAAGERVVTVGAHEVEDGGKVTIATEPEKKP